MISPSENVVFAIPLPYTEINCDCSGNYVPDVDRDSLNRIIRASGTIKGKEQLPAGSPPSPMLQKVLQNKSGLRIDARQIIPATWGGSGQHPDNLVFPTNHQRKNNKPMTLEEDIADHLHVSGNIVTFWYEFKYDGDSFIPSKRKRYIDIIHSNGYPMYFRNGVELKAWSKATRLDSCDSENSEDKIELHIIPDAVFESNAADSQPQNTTISSKSPTGSAEPEPKPAVCMNVAIDTTDNHLQISKSKNISKFLSAETLVSNKFIDTLPLKKLSVDTLHTLTQSPLPKIDGRKLSVKFTPATKKSAAIDSSIPKQLSAGTLPVEKSPLDDSHRAHTSCCHLPPRQTGKVVFGQPEDVFI